MKMKGLRSGCEVNQTLRQPLGKVPVLFGLSRGPTGLLPELVSQLLHVGSVIQASRAAEGSNTDYRCPSQRFKVSGRGALHIAE